jgi:DNA-binding NtrC family response regulator
VPPLRERREEIPTLINYYMNLYQQESAKHDVQLSEEAMDLMVVYDWPGNVRQLCNEVRRVVAYNESSALVTPDSLSIEIVKASRDLQSSASKPRQIVETQFLAPTGGTIAEAVEELERRMIRI